MDYLLKQTSFIKNGVCFFCSVKNVCYPKKYDIIANTRRDEYEKIRRKNECNENLR